VSTDEACQIYALLNETTGDKVLLLPDITNYSDGKEKYRN